MGLVLLSVLSYVGKGGRKWGQLGLDRGARGGASWGLSLKAQVLSGASVLLAG